MDHTRRGDAADPVPTSKGRDPGLPLRSPVRNSEPECRRSRADGGGCKWPRKPDASPRQTRPPSCRPSPPAIPRVPLSPLRREISDVSAIDVVGAKNARIDTMSEALIGLLDRCHDAECKVKRLHTLRIEARALYCRAIAGCRFESPARVMRAIAGSREPQAKPPRAM